MISPEELKLEVMKLAEKIEAEPKEIHIREMKRKWGSCSQKGRLTFNKQLLSEPKEVRYKIIIHELLHLRYPKHTKMFEILLKTYSEKSL